MPEPGPESGRVELWRVFPWDPRARDRDRFSPSHVPHPTGRGRFDLPRDVSRVLYVADSPHHAVGEMIQPWRGKRISAAHLVRASLPLALVRMSLDTEGLRLADLCDWEVLGQTGVQPDRSASRLRNVTQPLARQVWERGYSGLRWWSSSWGDWHTFVLFAARMGERLSFGEPQPLGIRDDTVREAAELLGIEVAA